MNFRAPLLMAAQIAGIFQGAAAFTTTAEANSIAAHHDAAFAQFHSGDRDFKECAVATRFWTAITTARVQQTLLPQYDGFSMNGKRRGSPQQGT